MTLDPELRQMLRDAQQSRVDLTWTARAWHAMAERVDIVSARFSDKSARPKGRFMLLDDVRHSARRLRARPGTALVAIVMLALAIGVTSTMFTVADHFVVRPAPFKNPARLTSVSVGPTGRGSVYLTPEIIRALKSTDAFADVEGIVQSSASFLGSDGLESAAGARVTPGIFSMLGVSPTMGRTFTEGEPDDRVMISERLWRSAFAADPKIIGRVVTLSNAPVTVVGVMPAWFAFPYAAVKVWQPINISGPTAEQRIQVFARLAPGAQFGAAEEASTHAALALSSAKPGDRVALRAITAGFLDDYSRTAIVTLSGGVALVFLILCANVANLILARTNIRRVEFGIASALGASRARLIRQVFMENVVIGLVAAIGGLAMAWLLTESVLSILPASIATRTLNPIGLDLRAFAVASALGFLATVVAGLPPAWIGTRVSAADSLRLSSRGSTDSRESRLWTRGLLIGEVALASMLLVGAGLLTTSFVRMMQIDPGIDTRSVMTAWVSLPGYNYKDKSAVISAAESLRAHMAAMPGIAAASLSFGMPPTGGALHFDSIDTDTGRNVPDQIVSSQGLGLDAFEVFGIKLLEGRLFENGGAADEVVMGSALATRLWPGMSAVGHSFRIGSQSFRVVGVAREVRSALNDPSVDIPEFYERFTPGSRQVMLGMRCAAGCPPVEAVRTWLRSEGAGFLIADVSSLEGKYALQFDKPRAAATLALIFAALALVASAGGLFSVLTYAVGQRRREFGVRVALGARPAQLQVMVIRDGLIVAATGLLIGASAVWLVSRWMSSLIADVSIASPVVWLSVVATLVASTVAAAWRPARSAGKADPISLLRDN